MNSKQKKLLNETYNRFIQTSLNELPLDGIEEFIDQKIMGYGTTLNEKILSISDYRKLVIKQKEQGKDIKMEFDLTKVVHKIAADGNSAVFVDEIVLKMFIQNEIHKLFMRLSTVLEYRDQKWIVVHWHGSKPEYEDDESDSFHVNEWKQKNADLEKLVEEKTTDLLLKNRELEIETVLEKVRTVAMGMQKAEDLLDVAEIINTELKILGFADIRNTMINIFNDNKEIFLNYDYSDYGVGGISEVDYNSHLLNKKFVNKMREASKDLMITELIGSDLDEWKKWRSDQGQMPDAKLDQAEGLYYYEYSIGIGSIGISTFRPISVDQLEVLKKIRNVFDLAYRRYNDITLAEAQAREAQIETALERVRSRSMAMHSSDEFVDASDVMVNQLKELRIDTLRIGICIINEEDDSAEIWSKSEIKGKTINTILGVVPSGTHPIFDNMVKAWKEKELFFSSERIGDEVREYYEKLSPCLSYPLPKEFNERESVTTFFFAQGSLNVISLEPLEEVDCNIMIRFAKVFGQIFQRFLDLQKAEAQAREAQIELALEKVRARTTGMQHSDELPEAANLLFLEMQALGMPAWSAGYCIWDEDKQAITAWMSSEGVLQPPFRAPLTEDPTFIRQLKAHQRGETFYVEEVGGEELVSHYKYMRTLPVVGKILDSIIEAGHPLPTFQINHLAYFSQGYLLFITYEPVPEAHDIFKRFSKVFQQTYTRFLDLQNAEAQVKEAQIEASLERVRAKAMAMHSSEDLALTIDLFFRELKNLNVKPIRTGVGIKDGDSRIVDVTVTSATENGDDIKLTGKLSLEGHAILDKIYENLQLQTEYFPVLRGEEINEYYKVMNPDIEFPNFSQNDIQYGYYFHYQEGGVFAWTTKELLEEEINIFRRFTSVLSLTYRRFLDLKEAEEQAREAQIETALERVRSRTMGMQKSEELKEVIKIVSQQLTHLKINLDHSGFVVDYKPRGDWHFWIADEQDIPSKISHPYFESIWANQFNEAKEKGADFFATNLNFEEKNKFYNELLSYIPDLPEASRNFYLNCPGLAGSTVLFDNVSLYIENFSGIPYSDEENKILMRFGKVFQQTYTRFLDLQKAEAQAKEAQIETALEKVRSRSLAMHSTEELQDVVRVVAERLQDLDVVVDPQGAVICTYTPNTKDVIHWTYTPDQNRSIPYFMPYFKNAIWDEAWESKNSGEEYFSKTFPVGVKNKFLKTIFTREDSDYKHLPQEYKDWLLSSIKYTLSFAWGENSALLIPNNDGIVPTEEQKIILIRFAKVFEQAYIRFLDLQKAEAQSREAQIEVALERIRAQVTAMKESSELLDIVVTMRKEFVSLGHEAHYFWHMRYLPEIYEKAMTSGDGTRIGMIMTLPRHIHGDIKLLDDWEKSDRSTVVFAMDVETAVGYVDKMISLGNFELVDPNSPTIDEIRHIGGLTFIMASTTHGEIGYSLPGMVPNPPAEDLAILVRFAGVFDLAYKRFEDLKSSERQNREAEIELALERVRARTMAMQKSSELAQTAAHLFAQLNELGVKPYRCNIAIVNAEYKNCQIWSTTNSGNVIPTASALPLNEYPVLQDMYSGWKTQKVNHIIKIVGQERLEWTKYISKHLPFEEYKSKNIDEELVLKEPAFFSNFYFRQGFFTIHSKTGLTEEQLKIIQRFAYVFEQTYTRFLDLENAEKQNKLIQAENERKSQELEEARELQLAMLPKKLPQLPNLDIAVFMKTATEVGGDYYDFNVGEDGTLTAVIGDATGHGMKAGTIVTITKSLFNSLAAEPNILDTFSKISHVIKDMKFRQLSMCLLMIKIKENILTLSSAAMPPAYIYRKSDKKVYEISLNGMPLGALPKFPYKIEETTLNSGDTILLMSDGFPELFNNRGQMFGYEKAIKLFKQLAPKSTEDIILGLKNAGSSWVEDKDPDDDVTFVVIKIK